MESTLIPAFRSLMKTFKAMTPEERKIYNANYHAKNPEKVKAAKAKWCFENPEKVKAAKAKWCFENPEKVKAAKAKYYAKNAEKIIADNDKWKAENPEKAKRIRVRYQTKYYAKNSEKIKAKYIENLDLIYVKGLLRRKGFSTAVINANPELIEVQKIILKTKRLCKTSQN
jgi:hypothetical protein